MNLNLNSTNTTNNFLNNTDNQIDIDEKSGDDEEFEIETE